MRAGATSRTLGLAHAAAAEGDKRIFVARKAVSAARSVLAENPVVGRMANVAVRAAQNKGLHTTDARTEEPEKEERQKKL